MALDEEALKQLTLPTVIQAPPNVTNEQVLSQENIERVTLNQTALQAETARQNAAALKLAEDNRLMSEAQELRRTQVQDSRTSTTPQADAPQVPQISSESQVGTPQKANHYILLVKETLAGAKRGVDDVAHEMELDSNKIAKSEQQ